MSRPACRRNRRCERCLRMGRDTSISRHDDGAPIFASIFVQLKAVGLPGLEPGTHGLKGCGTPATMPLPAALLQPSSQDRTVTAFVDGSSRHNPCHDGVPVDSPCSRLVTVDEPRPTQLQIDRPQRRKTTLAKIGTRSTMTAQVGSRSFADHRDQVLTDHPWRDWSVTDGGRGSMSRHKADLPAAWVRLSTGSRGVLRRGQTSAREGRGDVHGHASGADGHG